MRRAFSQGTPAPHLQISLQLCVHPRQQLRLPLPPTCRCHPRPGNPPGTCPPTSFPGPGGSGPIPVAGCSCCLVGVTGHRCPGCPLRDAASGPWTLCADPSLAPPSLGHPARCFRGWALGSPRLSGAGLIAVAMWAWEGHFPSVPRFSHL